MVGDSAIQLREQRFEQEWMLIQSSKRSTSSSKNLDQPLRFVLPPKSSRAQQGHGAESKQLACSISYNAACFTLAAFFGTGTMLMNILRS